MSQNQIPQTADEDTSMMNDLPTLLKDAKQGSTSAQYILGTIYYDGDEEMGVEPDADEGLRWLRLAANQGDLDAQITLLDIYESNDLLPDDKHDARQWLLDAAEKGDVIAQYCTANLYHYGDNDLPADLKIAAHWYEAAAKQHHPISQLNFGYFCNNGEGIEKDVAAAHFWYSQAYEQLKNEACGATDGTIRPMAALNLALMHYQGIGVTVNFDDALRLFEFSAKAGNSTAQYFLGIMHSLGQGVQKNTEKAIYWFRLAADQGNLESIYRLGVAYFNGEGAPQNHIAGYALTSIVASEGDEAAAEDLSSIKFSQAEMKAAKKLALKMIEPGKLLKVLDRFVKKTLAA